MRGVPRSGLWSEEEIASSGTGSERAQVASVAKRKPPASPWHREWAGTLLSRIPEMNQECPRSVLPPGVEESPRPSARISAIPAANVPQSMRTPMAATSRHPPNA